MELKINISEDAYKGIREYGNVKPDEFYEIFNAIRNGKPVEENAIGTGHWIRFVENGLHKIKCNKCGYIEDEYATHIRNYCPNCGKRMEEEE